MKEINGIPLEGGVNDCHWVFERKCTNPAVTRHKIPKGYSRDWDSKQNCPLTILGVIYCSGFKFMLERQNSVLVQLAVVPKGERNESRPTCCVEQSRGDMEILSLPETPTPVPCDKGRCSL